MKNYKVILILAALTTITACKKSSDAKLVDNSCSAEVSQKYSDVISTHLRFGNHSSASSIARVDVACVNFKMAIGNNSCISNQNGTSQTLTWASASAYCSSDVGGSSGGGPNGGGRRGHKYSQVKMKLRDVRAVNSHLATNQELIYQGRSVPTYSLTADLPSCKMMSSVQGPLFFSKTNRFWAKIISNTSTEIRLSALDDTLQIRCTRGADRRGRKWNQEDLASVFSGMIEVDTRF